MAHREPDLSAIRWSRLLGDSHFGIISLNCRVKEWRVTLGVTLAVSAVSSFVPV